MSRFTRIARDGVCLLAAAALLFIPGSASAAAGSPSYLNIDVAIVSQVSVAVNDVNKSTYTGVSWNTANANQELVAGSSTTVTNDSSVSERWALSAASRSSNIAGNAGSWSLVGSTSPALPGADQFAVQAVFGSSNTAAGGCPGAGDGAWNDGSAAPLLSTQQLYSSSLFAAASLSAGGGLPGPDNGGTGYMLAGAKRVLCWRIIAPGSTTTTDAQNIQLVVTAQP